MTTMESDTELFARFHAAASPEDRGIAAVMQRVKANYHRTDSRDDIVEEALSDLAREALENTAPGQTIQRAPGRGMVLTAESGQGKSRIVQHALMNIPAFSVAGRFGRGCVTLRVSTPKPSSLSGLGLHILDRLGYPLTASRKSHEIWRRVRQRLWQLGIMFLWVDEFQHVIDRRNLAELREIRDTLKALLEYEGWPVYVIVTGLPHLVTLLEEPSEDPENDMQAVRRYAFLSLPGLDLPTEMKVVTKALADAAATAGLGLAFDDEKDLRDRLVHAGLGRFGLTIEMIGDAVRAALVAGDTTLDETHFTRMYEKRTGSKLAANPFAIENWWEVNCKAVLQDENGELVRLDRTQKTERPF